MSESNQALLVSEPYLIDEKCANGYLLAAPDRPTSRRRVNIHNDLAAARKAGYRAPIVAGEHTWAFLAGFLADQYGARFIRGGRLELAFIKPVLFGETIRAAAREIGRCGDSVGLEVWVENAGGERVATGRARVRGDGSNR
ncbi:MAG TPA: MaoC family dehydratase, partial [Candidatus Binataceae bacterium]